DPTAKGRDEARVRSARRRHEVCCAESNGPCAVGHRGAKGAAVVALCGERAQAETPRGFGPCDRRGERRQRVARREQRVSDSPACSSREDTNARVGVTEALLNRGVSGVAAIFSEEESSNKRRIA